MTATDGAVGAQQQGSTPSETPEAAPDAIDVEALLEPLRGETVHYVMSPGNAGDSLIGVAALQMLRRLEMRLRLVRHTDYAFDSTGAILVYPGGGGVVPLYGHIRKFVEAHHGRARRIILLPQGFIGHEDFLAGLGDTVDLIAREPLSYAHIRAAAPGARTHLAHDLAFSLDLDDLMHGPLRLSAPPLREAAKLVRHFIRRARMTLPAGDALDCFREDKERTGRPIPPGNIDLPQVLNAGSVPEMNARIAARDVMRVLDRYRVIRTSRLHMCIGGLLLGKQVFFEDNSYGKCRRIYDFSIRDRYPNVVWVDHA